MDNTIVNVFIPLLAAVLTEGIQILVDAVKKTPPGAWRRRRRLILTSAVAIVTTVLIFLLMTKATHCAITNQSWVPYTNDGLESTVALSPDLTSRCGLEISFDLKPEKDQKRAYVAVYNKLDPKFMAWSIQGLQFSYSGTGNPNTIELKLFDTDDAQYKVVFQNASDTKGKIVSVAVPYAALRSAADGSPFHRDLFSPDRLDFTFSNWEGDTPGAGNVILHNVGVILSWQGWLILFGPGLLLAILTAHSLRKRQTQPTEGVYVDGL